MADSKESAGDSKDKDSATYLKRREQVRRAQRTHRERKESYIKSLETDVLRLRTNEARILQETRNLYAEIGRLKSILEHHGIPYGSSQDYTLPSLPSDSSGPPSISSAGILSNPQQLHVSGSQNFSGVELYLSESSEGSLAAESAKGIRPKRSFFRSRGHSHSRSESGSNGDTSGSRHPAQADISAISTSTSNLNLQEIDPTALGMEFVLTLEAPCLHHIQPSPSDPHLPTGHALTASAPLLFQSPTQPVPTTNTKPTHWETPNLALENLLSLSSTFDLDDELTPVQAWHQIRSHPDFASVDLLSLRRLTQDMKKHVKCHGFGAAIETDVFGALLRDVLPGRGFSFGF